MTPLPPKQGLKPEVDGVSVKGYIGYDTTSTKTRIETLHNYPVGVILFEVMTPLPPKQGLKQNLTANVCPCHPRVMTPLPPKQGLKPFSCVSSGSGTGEL